MIWNEKYESMDLENLKNVQLERLQKIVKYVYENVPFYKSKLDRYGIRSDSIKSLSDIKKLPFTDKNDLRDNYPFGLFAQPLDKITEIHVSSGTTGNPTVVGYAKEDIDLWMEVMARAIACAGGEPGDMIQNAYGYGLFTGGLGVHYGALKMGLTVLPMSSGQTKRQLKIMQDFKPRLLSCTPSYALYMAEEAKQIGLNPQESSWEVGIFGAEPWSDSMRKEIEQIWNISATDIYGLSEIIGPGVAQECPYKEGLHIFSDLFYPEIVNPDTGQAVPEGADGELVITTLTKVGMPLLRYKTRDIVSLNYNRCKCGRTSPRISKIKGRTDDMIVVRGINVFPSQIEHVLLSLEGIEPHYQIVVDRRSRSLDELEIWVEVQEDLFSDEVKQLEALQDKIRREIESVLGIMVKVKLVEPKTIERSMGKAKRVVDKRQF